MAWWSEGSIPGVCHRWCRLGQLTGRLSERGTIPPRTHRLVWNLWIKWLGIHEYALNECLNQHILIFLIYNASTNTQYRIYPLRQYQETGIGLRYREAFILWLAESLFDVILDTGRKLTRGGGGGLCNTGYSSETRFKLKSCEKSLIHNVLLRHPIVLKFYTKHHIDTDGICEKIKTKQNKTKTTTTTTTTKKKTTEQQKRMLWTNEILS